eukprot:gb/GEZN01008712.1/.p1 GENE.gb/GEZN01008712.1/~~gb/GEZN01008712.1/.p1  ORF type:complete len:171 (+),score=25.15 gb/GEZN01008712.1/:374-886(+)
MAAPSHMQMANRITSVEFNGKNFVLMDTPTDSNLAQYIQILKKKNVTLIARACEPSYTRLDLLQEAGIGLVELPFKDGDPPPDPIVDKFLDCCRDEFKKGKDTTVAVHCVAGLGRAPVLVAVALVEYGMEPLDAIEYIRKRRRGAINAKQLTYLQHYKRRRTGEGCCVIL